jgi:branched-chain amino acid aminotransferase
VVGGVLRTAPKTNAVLPGVTRDLVVKLARDESIPLEERPLTRPELARTAELFLTGTTSEVLPVVAVDGHPLGAGRPGPITRRLQEAYGRVLQAFLSASV